MKGLLKSNFYYLPFGSVPHKANPTDDSLIFPFLKFKLNLIN